MARSKAEAFSSFKMVATNAYARHLVTGVAMDSLAKHEICPDRRYASWLVKELLSLGYLTQDGGAYRYTSKAFDEADCPAWGVDRYIPNSYDLRHAEDSGWSSFCCPDDLVWIAKKYQAGELLGLVIRFRHSSRWRDGREMWISPDFTFGGGEKFQQEFADKGYGRFPAIQFACDAFGDHRTKKRRDRIEKMVRGKGLDWYLLKIQYLSHDLSVQAEGSMSKPKDGLGNTPSKWESDWQDSLIEIDQEVSRLAEKRTLLLNFEQHVRSIGGWDVLRSQYEQAVLDEVERLMGLPE